MARAILYDSTLCIGCRECEKACSAGKHLRYDDQVATEETTSAHKLTAIRTYGERFSRKLCMHCLDPACVSVCPVAALQKTAAGPVIYAEERCMGCRYCMVACPFGVPTYQWNARLPLVRKCDLCNDRASANQPTRCSDACPTGATITGGRDELIAEARRRLAEKPTDYYQRIYGLQEAGGTSVLILSAVSFDEIGYDTNVEKSALPQYTWNALKHIPDVVTMGTVLMGGIYWLSHRKEEVASKEGGE